MTRRERKYYKAIKELVHPPAPNKIYCIYNWLKPDHLKMCKEDILGIKAFGKIVKNYLKMKRIDKSL